EAGPTLMFRTLPTLFAQMAGGYFVALAFFVLVLFAALTSSVSLLEPVVAFTMERFRWKRGQATWITGGIAFVVGVFCALSFNDLSHIKFGQDIFFDFLNKLTSSVMLPL